MGKVGKIQKHNLGPGIFELLTQEGKSSKEIAAILTAQGATLINVGFCTKHIKKGILIKTVFNKLKSLISSGLPEAMTEPLLDAKDVKRLLRISLPLVYKLAKENRLPCIRIPCPGKGTEKPRTILRFKQRDVFDFIENHYRAT